MTKHNGHRVGWTSSLLGCCSVEQAVSGPAVATGSFLQAVPKGSLRVWRASEASAG